MNKIKYIILVFSITFLCGCSVQYNLNIDNNTSFNEQIIIDNLSGEDYDILKGNSYNFSLDYNDNTEGYYEGQIPGITYYDKQILNNQIIYSGSFNKETFQNSKAVNSSVDFFKITKYEDNYVISTSDNYVIFDNYNLNGIKVNIKLPNEVINSNADSVNGNVYTWNISKDNKKGIYLEYKPIDNKEITGTKEEDNNLKYILIAIGFLVFLLVGLIFIKKNKYKQ